MLPHRYIGILLIFRQVLTYDVLVFAVSHNDLICASEDALQALLAVHKHVACATTHEKLHSTGPVTVYLWQFCIVVIGSPEVARIVYHRFLPQQFYLLLQRIQCGGLRQRVWHVHDGSHPSSSCCHTLRAYVSLVRQTRIAEMHVLVDDTWQQVASRGVNDLGIGVGKRFTIREYLCYGTILYQDRALLLRAIVHDDGIVYQCTFHFRLNLPFQASILSCNTPNSASPKMLEFILEEPRTRLKKITETSFNLNPNL